MVALTRKVKLHSLQSIPFLVLIICSVMETVTSMQCCILAESQKLIPSRKSLNESLTNFLVELGRKYSRMSLGQSSKESSNAKALILDALKRFLQELRGERLES